MPKICGTQMAQDSTDYYLTIPFSRYSARLVRTLAAAPSEATFAMSCSTMSFTNFSNEVFDGFQPSLALALVESPQRLTTSCLASLCLFFTDAGVDEALQKMSDVRCKMDDVISHLSSYIQIPALRVPGGRRCYGHQRRRCQT